MSDFAGFDPAAVGLLAELANWSADDYADHKRRLADGLTKPGLALAGDLAERLDADLTVAARSSVSPLHRDLRFASPGAPRYKDHLLLTMWEGDTKATSPTLWLRLDAERVGFASGIGFTPAIREAWRSAVAGAPGETLATELDRLVVDRGAEVAGDQLKRVPPPHDDDHPRASLLRRTGFQVRFVEPLPDRVGRPDFAGWCADRFAAVLPVHRWLVAELTRPVSPPTKRRP